MPIEYTGPKTQQEFFDSLRKKWADVYKGAEFTEYDRQYLNVCAEHLFQVFQLHQKQKSGPVAPLHSDP